MIKTYYEKKLNENIKLADIHHNDKLYNTFDDLVNDYSDLQNGTGNEKNRKYYSKYGNTYIFAIKES